MKEFQMPLPSPDFGEEAAQAVEGYYKDRYPSIGSTIRATTDILLDDSGAYDEYQKHSARRMYHFMTTLPLRKP